MLSMQPNAFKQDSTCLRGAQTPALHPNERPVSRDCARLTCLLLLFWRSRCFLPHYLEAVRETLGPVRCASTCEFWGWGRVNLFYVCAVPSCCSLTSKEETAFLD